MRKRTVLRGHVWMGASLAALGLGMALFSTPAGPLSAKRWKRALRSAREGNRASVRPNVSWDVATPAAHGLDASKLDALRDELAARGTDAFLLVRHGQIVYEWYGPGSHPNRRLPTSALAKATTGSLALMLALDSGYIQLDDHVTQYIPQWADEPLKADIRIRHLASHSSGIEEVPFLMGERGELHGWQKEYFDNDTARYTLALTRAPIQFPPGTEYSYSGTGYYVIATVLATAIRNTSTGDARTLLERRLMQPLEIPEDAWRISYGRKTTIGELDLYAIGSGAQYTARAVARVGQLMLNRGTWKGRQIVAPESVDAILGRDRPPPPNLEFDYPEPRAAYGWWTNQDGLWPSLPRSAFVGAGADHRILLVVPDLDLVMVRLGASLTGTNFGGTFWRELEEYLFEPLTGAIDATSVSSVRGAEQ